MPTPAPQAVSGASKAQTPETSSGQATSTNWSRLLLILSILVIAAGAAIGGYYGYEWWADKDDNTKTPPRSKSRW